MISEMAVVGDHVCFTLSVGYISRHTGTFNCLSVRIVSSGGIKICSRKIWKIISLILFAVVPDHRKSDGLYGNPTLSCQPSYHICLSSECFLIELVPVFRNL